MTSTNEIAKLDVRVYPIDEPKGKTLAFANITVDDMTAIRGLRVVNGENGLFTVMPQTQDNKGLYHDVAFPVAKGLRDEINAAVLNEFFDQINLNPTQRGYVGEQEQPEEPVGTVEGVADGAGRQASDVKLDVKVYPIDKPRGDKLAFASVTVDDKVAISGLSVVGSKKGNFVTLPHSKDKNGKAHDIAFPLSGEVRRAISNKVLTEFKQKVADKKQSIGDQLDEGKQQAAAYVPAREPAAKKVPGLGD